MTSVRFDTADRLATLHTVRRRVDRRALWFDIDLRDARRHCRRCERRYRKTCSITDRRQWVDAAKLRFQLYRRKEAYSNDRVLQDG